MRKDLENREELDRFSEYMRERLAGHRMPDEVPAWEELEQRMQRRPASRKRLALGVLAGAAAALLLFLFQLDYEENPDGIAPRPIATLSDSATVRQPEGQPIEPAPTPETVRLASANARFTRAKVPVFEAKPIGLLPAAPTPLPATYPSSPAKTKGMKKITVSEVDRKRWIAQATENSQSRGGWGIAAAFGTGSNVSLALSDGDMFYDPMETPDVNHPNPGHPLNPSPERPITPVRDPETFSHKRYLPPLSFGVTARKMLTPYVGIESGLVYTYLATRLSDGNASGELDLHYIGMPLNAVFRLWERSRWNLSLSLGVTGEKGIRSVYRYREEQPGSVVTLSERGGIHGMQWSLNGSLDIAYRLQGGWHLYLEPRLGYYFENHQPLSIRSNRRLGIGLAGGLRYEF